MKVALFVGALLMILVVVVNCHGSSDQFDQKRPRLSLSAQMAESYVVLHDFGDLKIALKDGVGEAIIDPDYPKQKATLRLLPIMQDMASLYGTGRGISNYVFGVAILDMPGEGHYGLVLVFEDMGRTLGFVSSAVIGKDVSVIGILIGPEGGGARDKFAIRVQIMERGPGRSIVGVLPARKNIQFTVNEREGTLVRKTEELSHADEAPKSDPGESKED